MPQSSTSTSLAAVALPSSPRRRRQKHTVSTMAVSAAAALVLLSCPSSVHAEGGLRGGSPQLLPQHESHEDPEPKLPLSVDEEEAEEDASAQEERTLAKRDEEVVIIDAFTVNLLATKFPYQMKDKTDNKISSAVASYLAASLDEALGSSVINLGLDCTKDSQPMGQGERWVLSCEGKAIFKDDESDKDVNNAVKQAFVGENKNHFLEIMYPKYEMMHEKREYDTRFTALQGARRRGGGRGKKQGKKQNGRGKKGKKNKQKNKNKKPHKMNHQMMKPQSASLGGKNNSNKNNLNVMGYVSGQQQMQAYSGKNTDKDGNIIVNIP